MLKPKVLNQVLSQVTNGGVQTTVLSSLNGSLLAYSGRDLNDAKVVAAISSNIFNSYKSNREKGLLPTDRRNAASSDSLHMILFDAEEGKMAINIMANHLISMLAKSNVEMGMLKAKMNAVSTYLEAEFSKLPECLI